MKKDIQGLLEKTIYTITETNVSIEVLRTKSEVHGDWTTNVAMILAKELKKNPRDLAYEIISSLGDHEWIDKVEIAGPGFINFFLSNEASLSYLKKLIKNRDFYFSFAEDTPKKILIEYVSCNPTGPIHVGHGRGAAFGSALTNLLMKAGNDVIQEYYVNDRGLQSETLGLSVCLR